MCDGTTNLGTNTVYDVASNIENDLNMEVRGVCIEN